MADVISCSSRFACCYITKRVHKHDSGWAWVVVICGSLCNAFVLGCSYSFGVIYPSLLDEFKRGKAQTGKFSPVKQCYGMIHYAGIISRAMMEVEQRPGNENRPGILMIVPFCQLNQ